MAQQHVVFMNVAATGHMNPTLPLVAELKAHGCKVTYFVDSTMRQHVEAAGAEWCGLPTIRELDAEGVTKYVPEGTPKEEYEGIMHRLVRAAEITLPSVLKDLAALEPPASVIVYDPFLAAPRVAGHVMGLPTVALLTQAGPGVCAKPEAVYRAWRNTPWIKGPADAILQNYGFDVLASGVPMEFPPEGVMITATIEELFAPPVPSQASMYAKTTFHCVGTLSADMSVKRIANANVQDEEDDADLLRMIDHNISLGHRIVYISMGTVASAPHFWRKPFGVPGRANGVMECTGKKLIQHVFKACIEALSGDSSTFVVMALGAQDDTLEGLPALPTNFVARKTVPQLEVLRRSNVFLTHGGANSLHEALKFAVPMVVVPCFGDQLGNSATVVKSGVGLAFAQPLESVSTSALSLAFETVLTDKEGSFKAAANVMQSKLQVAGGVKRSVEIILHQGIALRSALVGGA